jgi:4'-phosphopantetheinyl transferase
MTFREDTHWEPPPPALSLSPHEVHVWRLTLEPPEPWFQRLGQTLTPEEQARARRFVQAIHGRHFTAARGWLRFVLSLYLHRLPASLRFDYGPHGKPFFPAAENAGDLQFNLSHSHGAALIGITRGRDIGIDVEQVRPMENLEDIARRFFSPSEVAALAMVSAAEKEEAFFRCWTRKEAFIKAGGEGLTRPLDEFSVSLRAGEPACLLEIGGSPEEAARWTLREVRPWPGFIGCVAVPAQGWELRCWDGSMMELP